MPYFSKFDDLINQKAAVSGFKFNWIKLINKI